MPESRVLAFRPVNGRPERATFPVADQVAALDWLVGRGLPFASARELVASSSRVRVGYTLLSHRLDLGDVFTSVTSDRPGGL